jgi:hypothetical protein
MHSNMVNFEDFGPGIRDELLDTSLRWGVILANPAADGNWERVAAQFAVARTGELIDNHIL